ncbi:head-tail connector protein [Clostridium sp. D2Q-11]|uniref:Head-tail connector protein n=1 Tax=Anaeromonas frigoriresistens TaxID=2683708 RepID=A0A942UTC7_9FIRM|nr:head-tail connector protein [Anaeromonas frigoriresistens]MBS4538213.1 head-tail connector protein [Anaeromonas frigoriresistens]
MIEDVKLSLRIKSNAFDAEIEGLIDAAISDLKLSGVLENKINTTETDPLIKRAVILYCKANFGYDNPHAEKFMDSYVMLKTHLTLSTDYTEEVV